MRHQHSFTLIADGAMSARNDHRVDLVGKAEFAQIFVLLLIRHDGSAADGGEDLLTKLLLLLRILLLLLLLVLRLLLLPVLLLEELRLLLLHGIMILVSLVGLGMLLPHDCLPAHLKWVDVPWVLHLVDNDLRVLFEEPLVLDEICHFDQVHPHVHHLLD